MSAIDRCRIATHGDIAALAKLFDEKLSELELRDAEQRAQTDTLRTRITVLEKAAKSRKGKVKT